MGREIRRVPPGWEHPKDGDRDWYFPKFDKSFDTAKREWAEGFMAWEAGADENRASLEADGGRAYYWEWAGAPPDAADLYRPEWPAGAATAYQVYETVSEGTPVSPVFSSLAELEAWLVTQGYSSEAARAFAEGGWAPSAVIAGGVMYRDI
ncbi:MAG: hypothetical protein AAB368_08730 [bacterium]